jgi:hypothetical protein
MRLLQGVTKTRTVISRTMRRSALIGSATTVREPARPFSQPFSRDSDQTDRFTKTGSGQTQEKPRQKERVFSAAGGARSEASVVANFASVQKEYPNAKVITSTFDAFLPALKRANASGAKSTSENAPPFFECFPCVCPEPVLVKSSF